MPRMGKFLLLCLPGAVIALVLIYVPVATAMGLGFFQLDTVISTPRFTGLENFERVLVDDAFWNAFVNGLVYSALAVILQIVLGVSFALVLRETFKGVGILRGAVIFPYVVPTVVGVLVWRWMLDPNGGVIDEIFQSVGLQIPWLATPTWAMITVVLISVWLWTPFVTITVLAALQTVSPELEEAAHIDGTNALQRFRYVVLPQIVPILLTIVLLRGIWMFNKFDVIYLTTGGGPLESTEHLPILSYDKAFRQFQIGEGAAIAGLNFVFLVVAVVVYLRATRRWTDA
ncbi:sugar ABC transporter permease [Nocardioides endophyticus]|uniref:Sugar ABC transporter permease n=2 Tax=Nocardioides endophyticus TaxID=1353775 RepID=A0ABP8ZAY4_9ACTN